MACGVAALTVLAVVGATLSRTASTRLRGGIATIDGKKAIIARREGASVQVSLPSPRLPMPVTPKAIKDTALNVQAEYSRFIKNAFEAGFE